MLRSLPLQGALPEPSSHPRFALASKGFRPFFLLAATFACCIVPLWILVVAGLLLSVAVILPPVLLEQADPLVPLSYAPPRWYLLPVRESLRGLPGGMAALAVVAFTLLLFLVPALDRQPVPSTRNKIVHRTLGILVIAAWVLLGVRGYLR